METGVAVLNYDQPTDARNRIVVVFADGSPGGIDAPAMQAYEMKVTHGAEVYTIACMDDADGTLPDPIPAEETFWSSLNSTNKLFHLLSSNYPEGEKTANRGALNSNLVGGTEGYYLVPESIDGLDKVFDKIYDSVETGGANIKTLGTETVTKDVVSNHFVIGDGAVNFWTASYIAKDTWEKDTTIDSGVRRDPETEDNVVSITGFDYSENYVGVDTAADGTETYRGKKLVIEIPIKPADGNNGGVAMDTNVPINSGIFLDGEAQEHFDQPKVDIPTDVTISKTIVGGSQTSFDFDLTFDVLIGYSNNDGTSGNYLQAIPNAAVVSQPITPTAPKELEKVLIGTTLTLTEKAVPNYTVEYSVNGGETWTEMTYEDGDASAEIMVTAGMEIKVRNTLKVVDLTIHKEIFDGKNPDQRFMFTVVGGDKNLTVVIPVEAFEDGKASVIVKDLLIGDYTVTELTDWSWRYTVVDEKGDPAEAYKTVTLSSIGEQNAVTFINNRTEEKWLDGEAYAKNSFDAITVAAD